MAEDILGVGVGETEAIFKDLAPGKVRLSKQEAVAGPTNGNSVTMFSDTGAGIIDAFWWVASGATSQLNDMNLQVFVDGEVTPSIDVEMGTLFLTQNEGSSTATNTQASTQHFHMEAIGTAAPGYGSGYLKFPIPYSNGVTVKIKNVTGAGSPGAWYWQTYSRSGVTAPYRLKSKAITWPNRLSAANTVAAPLFDISPGAGGWLVWLSLCEIAASTYSYLERNVQVRLDGEASPSYESSGTEDFFLGSTYFTPRPQGNLYSAVPVVNQPLKSGNWGIDLLALHGGIKFDSRLKMDLSAESSHDTSTSFNYTYAALYYVTSP